MKNLKAVARNEIIKDKNKNLHDDEGLQALNEICIENFQVDDTYDEELLLREFQEKHPGYKHYSLERVYL